MIMLLFFVTFAAPMALAADPTCIADPAPKNNEEMAVDGLTKQIADDEMMARLVYAEALAANCFPADKGDADLVQSITDGIAWTVQNRVTEEKKTPRQVVLAKGQYRSTMGSCDVAKRKHFLCPLASDLVWQKALESVAKARVGKGNPFPGARNYFFPKAFDDSKNCSKWKGVLPAWAQPEKVVSLSSKDSPALKACVTFYRLGGIPKTATAKVKTPDDALQNHAVFDQKGLKKLPLLVAPQGVPTSRESSSSEVAR
jgi:hypothetical protein